MSSITNQTEDTLREIKLLTLAIQKLPPIQLVLLRKLSIEQNQIWQHRQNYWRLIGQQLDYLQLDQLGFKPTNLLESVELHPAFKELINITAKGFLAELNLMNVGWDLIKVFAAENKTDFPFENPRQMLAERCKQLSMLQAQNFLTNDINQGITLDEVREDYRHCTAFMRDRLDPDEEKTAFSALLNSGDWFGFTVCAIWNYRQDKNYKKGELKKTWKAFLQSFKEESAMWCRKDYFKKYGVKLSSLKWSEGKPVCADSSQKTILSP
ncbi:hypothetical protein NIES267_75610 (plasmid) [Calothrix parasitica NIES-267]|uniref:Uncharacterized protein n=1 Tax=Calothrix parasitica NIES-267 TaxID=1973488 RepID=A0A1Z4M3G4_9CYAN|nr:hypothetical protein NIES267_75610 [Calothrix parasitica NIES-267]